MWAAMPPQVRPLKLSGIASHRRRPSAAINYELKPQHTAAEAKKRPEEQQLTGAGVLTALQKATAAKHRKRKNNSNRREETNATKDKDAASPGSFSGEVRPLSIKSEWSQRLEELQRRLIQLTHNTS